MEGDIFGYSPDIGRIVIRNEATYTQYGAVYPPGSMFRWLPCDKHADGNYADWTDEHRAAVRAETERKIDEEERRKKIEREAREKLIASARTKITQEEYDAIVHQACIDERGYE